MEWTRIVTRTAALALVVSFAGHAAAEEDPGQAREGSTCATSATGGHTACIRITSTGSVYGQLKNDSSKRSCGDFRLNLTTYEYNGHRNEHAGDQFRKDSCLGPGQTWETHFSYVDGTKNHDEYDGRRVAYYNQLCVKGYRLDKEYELITGSACQ